MLHSHPPFLSAVQLWIAVGYWPCQQHCPPGAASPAKPQKKESLLGIGSSSQAALPPANHPGSRLSFQHPDTQGATNRSTTDALDPPSSSHLRAASRNSRKDLQWFRRRATCVLVGFLGQNWNASSHRENFLPGREMLGGSWFFFNTTPPEV